MIRFFRSSAGAAVLWVIGSLILAALLAPWLYLGGKWLVDLAAAKELPGFFEWLAVKCDHAKLSRFFSRALMFSALVLLPLLLRRIRTVRLDEGESPWPLQRIPWKSGLAQMVAAFFIAAAFLWATGMTVSSGGAFHLSPDSPSAGTIAGKIWLPTVLAPLIEECLFRGLLLGLWLRFAKPLAAFIGCSLLFAFVHFLEAPKGTIIANPGSPLAGLELLGKIVFHFTEPRFFVTDFATLFVIGMILAWARLRTASLWFPIGLHAGWIAAFKGFNMLYDEVPDSSLHPWWVGDSLRSGLFPMIGLLVTAAVCHFAMRPWAPKPAAISPASR